jgi:hypothetical protein
MLQMFPLLALSLAIYALLNLTTGSGRAPWHESETFSIRMLSGDVWQISGGHLFIAFSMLLLFIELLRATKSGGSSILNHAFSVVVFIAALLLFLLVRGYGNSTFFIFMSMTLLDFMAGFIITTVSSRRDVAFGRVND